MHKQQFVETIRPITSDSEIPITDGHEAGTRDGRAQWQPGFWARFPWIGFGALVTILLCVTGSVITLVISDGESETHWPEKIAPNVILAGMNGVANICFGIAIGNGIAIAWWRQTLKGASMQELHRSWAFSTSIKDIFFSLKHFNIIALAALAAKLTIIDGMFMQRATSNTLRMDSPVKVHNIRGFANETFPITGAVDGKSGLPAQMTHWTGDSLRIWSKTGGSFPNFWTGCDGLCFVDVPAAGLAFDCSTPEPFDVDPFMVDDRFTLFDLGFEAFYPRGDSNSEKSYSYLEMNVEYFQVNKEHGNKGQHCPGTKYKQRCELRPAIIKYPVQIQHYSGNDVTTIGLNPTEFHLADPIYDDTSGHFNHSGMQQNGFEILDFLNLTEADLQRPLSHLAGIELGFRMHLGGNDYLTKGKGEYNHRGNSMQYLMNTPRLESDWSCAFEYMNPLERYDAPNGEFSTPSVIAQINQMMFALATDISLDDENNNRSHTNSYNATMYKESIHYVTHYAYMFGAVASTLCCVLLVLPTYWGFWQLGRKVTLGPFEIAHAFRSPMTAQASNAEGDELMKQVGHRQIKYGQIVAGDSRGILGVAEPEHVARIHPGIRTARYEVFGRRTRTN